MSTYTGVTNLHKTVQFFWPTLYMSHENREVLMSHLCSKRQ